MGVESIADLTIIVAILATLIYATYRDVKYRDIPEVTWLPASLLALGINLYQGNYDLFHTAFSLLPAFILLVMSFIDLIGGADFLALLMISVAHPRFLIFPISFLTLFYSLLIPLALMLYYMILNIKYGDVLRKIECVSGSKLNLKLFGRPMTIKDYLHKEFIYPLTVPADEELKGYVCRASFGSDDEEEKIKERIKDLVDRGLLSEESIIWVTPGLPHIAFFLVGYVLALLTPQSLILSVLTTR